MSSRKASHTTQQKRKLVRTTIAMKKEIIAKYERGSRVSDLASEYKMPRTTISTIVKNKEAIKGASVARGVKSVTKQRSQTLEEVEKLLYIWINGKQLVGESISEARICKKAKQLHADLLKEKPGGSGQSSEVFKASHGWFDKFKKRTGIRSVVRHGATAKTFVHEFMDYVEAESFISHQVFNFDETGLFWKRMPNRTYITQEEKTVTPRVVTSKGFVAEPSPTVEDIAFLGKSMGLEVSDEDIEELVEEHREDLSTDELQELQMEQQHVMVEEIASGEDKGREKATTALLNEMCAKWNELQNFVEKYHPDKALARRNVDLFNDQIMSRFRNILKRRQKQFSLDRFLVKLRESESPSVNSETKRRKRKRTPVQVPDVLLEENSSSKS